MPWAELFALVEPHYSKGEVGRKPVGVAETLALHDELISLDNRESYCAKPAKANMRRNHSTSCMEMHRKWIGDEEAGRGTGAERGSYSL
jgi:hypothetical protein